MLATALKFLTEISLNFRQSFESHTQLLRVVTARKNKSYLGIKSFQLKTCFRSVIWLSFQFKAMQRSFKNEEGYYLIEGTGHTVKGTKNLSICNTNGKCSFY